MKLKKMTDFVLDKQRFKEDSDTAVFKITNYANFLKQPLKLEMFVPCDEEGNVFEEPDKEFELSYWDYSTKISKYQQAKEKVLFEDFELTENNKGEKLLLGDYTCLKVLDLDKMNIELLTKYTTINLTPNAIKQLGL